MTEWIKKISEIAEDENVPGVARGVLYTLIGSYYGNSEEELGAICRQFAEEQSDRLIKQITLLQKTQERMLQ